MAKIKDELVYVRKNAHKVTVTNNGVIKSGTSQQKSERFSRSEVEQLD